MCCCNLKFLLAWNTCNSAVQYCKGQKVSEHSICVLGWCKGTITGALPTVDIGLLYVVPVLSQGLAAVVGVMLVVVAAAAAA